MIRYGGCGKVTLLVSFKLHATNAGDEKKCISISMHHKKVILRKYTTIENLFLHLFSLSTIIKIYFNA